MAAGGSEGVQLAHGKGRWLGAQAGRVETDQVWTGMLSDPEQGHIKPWQARGRKQVVVGLECCHWLAALL